MRTEAQLREIFNQTVATLPPRARSTIENFWETHRIPFETIGSSRQFFPPVEKAALLVNQNVRRQARLNAFGLQSTAARSLADARYGAEVLARSRGICGQTDGLFFRFKSSVVDQAPDLILKSVIGHELGHAHRAAEAGQPFPQAAIIFGTTEQQEEDAANALMAEWRFDRNEMLRWLQENEGNLRI